MAVLSMRAFRRLGVAAAVVLAGTGCDFTRAPTALELDGPTLGVHAVLEAGAASVDVLVTWTRVAGGLDGPLTEPAPGASVRLVRGVDTMMALPLPADEASCVQPPEGADRLPLRPGCYRAAVPNAIAPGDRFELLVRLGGRVVEGSATVPAPPLVHAPFAGDTLRVGVTGPIPGTSDAVTPRWSAALNRYVELSFVSASAACQVFIRRSAEDFGTVWLEVADADSATVMPFALGCGQGAPEVVPAHLHVAVFDTAYARYARDRAHRDGSVPQRRASPGLSGAVGVFGAAATARIPVFLREG